MADRKFIIEISATGNGLEIVEKTIKAEDKLRKSEAKTTAGTRAHTKSKHEQIKANKGAAHATNNSTKAFSKMSQGMEGTLVPAYAAVAANVFALTAAFGALSRAADLEILIKASDELATTTGRNLTTVASSMKEITGEAISMQEALTNASLAASAGFDNSTIEQLTKVARDASVALGRDMTDSLNRIFKGAIKAEPELLDELGIIVRLDKASRDYAATLGRNVKTLTTFEKQTAVVNAVLSEGEKKFSAISDVDTNPYAKLSAAFHDVAVNLTNFIAVPIGPVISFLTDNIESLAAVLVIFGARILKTAFPALDGFSSKVTEVLGNVTKTLDAFKSKAEDFKLGLLTEGTQQTLKKTGKEIDSIIKTATTGFEKLDKKPGAGFNNLTNEVSGSESQLKKFGQVYRPIVKRLEQGIDSGGFKATRQNIDMLNRALDKTSVASIKATKDLKVQSKVAVTGLARIGVAATTAATAVIGLGTSFVTSMSKSVAATAEATGALATLKGIIFQVGLAAKADAGIMTKAFMGVGAAVGGIGAALFKSIPFIGTAVIAWQILSSVFSGIHDMFFDADIIKLTESIENQEEALNKSAKAAKFFESNLKSLPKTLDNVNKQLELQSNLLTEMFTNLDEVVNDVDLSNGFSTWQSFLDMFGQGDLDDFKDNLEGLVGQISKIGFDKEAAEILEKYGDISGLSATKAKLLGEELRDLNKELRDSAQGAKEAGKQINDSIEALGKSILKISGALPSLSGVEESFIGINFTLAQLDTGNVLKLISAFDGLNAIALEDLGISELISETAPFRTALDASGTEISKLNKKSQELRDSLGGWTFNWKEITELENQVKFVEQGIAELDTILEGFADKIVDKLQEAANSYKELADAERKFASGKQAVAVDALLPNKSIIEEFKLTKKLRNLEQDRFKTLSSNRDKELASTRKIRKEQQELLKVAATAIKAEQDESKALALAGKIREYTATIKAADTAVLQLTKQGDKDTAKRLDTYIKGVKEAEKNLDSLYDRQTQGAKNLSPLIAKFESEYLIAIENVKIAQGGLNDDFAQGIAEAALLAKQQAQDYIKHLADQNIGAESQTLGKIKGAIDNTAQLELEMSLSNALGSSLDERLDKEYLINQAILERQILAQSAILSQISAIDNANLQANAIAELLRLEDLRVASIKEGSVLQEVAAKNAIISSNKELKRLKEVQKIEAAASKSALRDLKTRQKLEDALTKGTFKNKASDAYKKFEQTLKDMDKTIGKMNLAESLREGAEAMNEFADAMKDFDENSKVNTAVAGLLLLQDISGNMEGEFAKFGKGLATISLSIVDYTEKMNLTADATLQQKYATDLAMNVLGALAGSFDKGSKAAKVFTVAQQAVAIANAAAAVTQAAQLPPPAGIASAAAMLSLMATVLGAFGVSGGAGGGSSAPSAHEQYKDRIGSQGLLDRELQSNTLEDSIDQLVDIDTKLFSASRDLQVEMNKLNDSFSLLAAGVFGMNFQGTKGGNTSQSFDATSSLNASVGGITDLITGGNFLGQTLDVLTLGLSSIIGGALGGALSNERTLSSWVMESGLDFSATLQVMGENVSGALDTLAYAWVKFEDRTSHTFHSDSVTTWFDDVFADLDPILVTAFAKTFDSVIDSTIGLIKGLTSGTGANIATLFAPLMDLDLSETLILDPELDAEGVQSAIAAYFSSVTTDIAQATLPFLDKYQTAGEELGDTLIRLATNSIALNNALSQVSISTSDFTATTIDNGVINNLVSTAINEALIFSQMELDAAIAEQESIISNILSGSFKDIVEAIGNSIILEPINIAQVDTAAIERAVRAEAEAFLVDVRVAWEQALLTGRFLDMDEFVDSFNSFAAQVFSEAELLDIGFENATNTITNGFETLIAQTQEMGLVDLTSILQQGGFTAETLRVFYEEALATSAFDAVADFATGEINTAGAELLAIATQLGPAFDSLDGILEAIDAIDDLNQGYERQIALFGLLGKELDLLQLAFDFEDAMQEARETGTNLALVETYYGLERLDIVKKYYEETNAVIEDAMTELGNAMTEVSRNMEAWDDVVYTSLKIDKVATKLADSLGDVDFSLFAINQSMPGLAEFSENFQDIINNLVSAEGINSIEDQVELVNELRDLTMSKYEDELEALLSLKASTSAFRDSVKEYLDDLIISDKSPLTNFERLTEAQLQFDQNVSDLLSTDPIVVEAAQENLLSSADSLLDQASLFYSIGNEYQDIFDTVTSVLGDLALTPEEDPIQLAIDSLTTQTLEKLVVLDDILEQLKLANEDILLSDIQALGTVLLPSIDAITVKLQSLNDSTWVPILNALTGLNSYATGTSNVEYDQLAMIHKGEAVVPADQAAMLREGGFGYTAGTSNNADVVNAIQVLTQVLAESQEDIVEQNDKSITISEELVNSINTGKIASTEGVL